MVPLLGDTTTSLLLCVQAHLVHHQVPKAVQHHPVIKVTDCILALEPEPLTIAELGCADSILFPDLPAEFLQFTLDALHFC